MSKIFEPTSKLIRGNRMVRENLGHYLIRRWKHYYSLFYYSHKIWRIGRLMKKISDYRIRIADNKILKAEYKAIHAMATKRQEYKQKGMYNYADQMRKGIIELGWEIRDTKKDFEIRKK
jgi:cysteinyl-tRNA synthetase